MPTSTKPAPVRVVSRDFKTTLPASKAAGVVTIRLAQVKGDVTVEELNAKQQAVSSFRMHALLNSAKKITAIAVLEIGGSSNPKPFTAAQKAAFGRITAELTKVKTTTQHPTVPTHQATGHELSPHGLASDFLDALDVTLACGAAALEGGLNPLADAACVAAGAAASMNEYEESNSGDGNGSQDDNNGSQDDNNGGEDGGGGGGGDDTKDTGDDTKHEDK